MDNLETIRQMQSSAPFFRSSLEECFRKGFTSELAKVAEEEYDSGDLSNFIPMARARAATPYGTESPKRRESYEKFLKRVKKEEVIPVAPDLMKEIPIDAQSTITTAVRAADAFEREMSQSGSSAARAAAVVALPFTQRYLNGMLVHKAKSEIDERLNQESQD
jgi:hypothetical protein